MKFTEAFELFLAHGASERLYSNATTSKHRDCFRTWLLPAFGEKEVEEITRLDVLNLRQALVQKDRSISRQYSVVMTLRLFLKFASIVLDLRCLAPSSIGLPPRPRPVVDYLTNEEIEHVLEAIPLHTFTGRRLRALIEVFLATGLRLSEALSLDREPLDAGVSEIDVVGKGGKRRTIFISERCQAWVRHYLKFRFDTCPALFVTQSDSPERLRKEDVSRYFIELRKRTGIKKWIRPHLFRHTFCSNLLHNGADITFIRDLAGHRDIQTTARYYLGVDKKALRKAVGLYLNYKVEPKPGELPPFSERIG